MGVFKSLVDKAKQKKDELARKAAKQAAKTALEQSAKAAMGAIDSTGRAIEKALFGDTEEESAKSEDAAALDAKEAKPDPFAKLKAAEVAKREREADAARAGRAARLEAEDKEIDAELAALKKKLGQ
jgi:hypothetical protein